MMPLSFQLNFHIIMPALSALREAGDKKEASDGEIRPKLLFIFCRIGVR